MPEPNHEDINAFNNVLKNHNYTLTYLRIESLHCSGDAASAAAQIQREEMEFYLNLNKMGRGRLLSTGQNNIASTEEWMNVISDQNDLSVLFYFLRKNPSLCLPEKTPPASLPGAHHIEADGNGAQEELFLEDGR